MRLNIWLALTCFDFGQHFVYYKKIFWDGVKLMVKIPSHFFRIVQCIFSNVLYLLHLFYFCRLWMFFIQRSNLHENGSTNVALLIWSNFLFSLSLNFFHTFDLFYIKNMESVTFQAIKKILLYCNCFWYSVFYVATVHKKTYGTKPYLLRISWCRSL